MHLGRDIQNLKWHLVCEEKTTQGGQASTVSAGHCQGCLGDWGSLEAT